jgi:hypothetical protein
MPAYRTYKGARIDLEIYQGKSTIDYPIEVLDDDGGAADLSVYSSIVAKVFYRKHGEEIDTLTITNSLNVLFLDALKAETLALQTREYWMEIYGILIDPVGEEEIITFGILKND